jgi:D-3-phosphoglycerate dehydrogenase
MLAQRYQNIRFNDAGERLEGPRLASFLDGVQKTIVGLERVDRPLLSQLPQLKVVSKFGVGLDGINLSALAEFGVSLGWRPGVNRGAVAELVISQVINLLRGITLSHAGVISGHWVGQSGRELSNIVLGIVGCGNIGKELVRLLQPFGTQILVHDIRDYPEFYSQYNLNTVSLEQLLAQSDVVTLHLPLDDSTRNIMSEERLGLMKAGSCLINTARGGLVDEDALYDCLVTGSLHGAAFDVFENEPPLGNRLVHLPNMLSTAHIAGTTGRAVQLMGEAAIDGLENCVSALTLLD